MTFQIRFQGLSDTIRLLGCFSLDAVSVSSYTTEDQNNEWIMLGCERKLSATAQHTQMALYPSNECTRASVSFEGSLNLDPSSVLFAANEMIKNLFDMATDSFGLRSGTSIVYTSPSELESVSPGRSGLNIPYIYHPGAVTAAFDLLPAISEGNGTFYSEVCCFVYT